MMKQILHELTEHKSLNKDRSRQALIDLATGKFNPSQMSAFMTVYMMRPITLDELQGFRDAMLELCVVTRFDQPVMDVCGTGGDSKSTFNISTLSSFVVAAAGQPVAKHGNYGVSSVSGSSNVLEYFGLRFTNDRSVLERSLEKTNMAFMHAPLFHPAMKSVAPVRKELGVKTFFNMLGPMVNPAFPSRQMVGVFSLELARQYGYLYQQTKKDYAIVHDIAGYDEISLTGPFKIYSNEGERVLEPADLGFEELLPEQLSGGGSVKESAVMFMNILKGIGTVAQNNVVIANAGLALYTANRAAGMDAAIAKAREALESGRASETFERVLTLSI
jgi:anthranilate phosphoribosyltransferase